MRFRAFLIGCSILSAPLLSAGLEIPTDFSQTNKPATIKVLIEKQKDKILLEAKGRHFIYHPSNEHLISQESTSTKNWVTTAHNGLKWGQLFPGTFQIRIVPADSQTTILVNGIEFRGCVEIYDIKGKLFVVNEVDIERYLKAVMPSQCAFALEEEVMDAVAIAARTNAYYLATRKSDLYWHVDASEVGYQGYAASMQNLAVERAISSTRHMVLRYKGAYFPTTWTKDSAGRTADYTTIFRKEVTVPHGVEAPFAAHDRDKHGWTFTISKKDLAKALGAARVSEFEVYQDEKSKKVYGARINAGQQQFDFAKLQSALGAVRLKSNDFTVVSNGEQIIFKGFGEGNGVGLCLFSATAMADIGEKAPKILATFFPQTKLENVSSFDAGANIVKNLE